MTAEYSKESKFISHLDTVGHESEEEAASQASDSSQHSRSLELDSPVALGLVLEESKEHGPVGDIKHIFGILLG